MDAGKEPAAGPGTGPTVFPTMLSCAAGRVESSQQMLIPSSTLVIRLPAPGVAPPILVDGAATSMPVLVSVIALP